MLFGRRTVKGGKREAGWRYSRSTEGLLRGETEPSTSSLERLEHRMRALNAKDRAGGYDRDQAAERPPHGGMPGKAVTASEFCGDSRSKWPIVREKERGEVGRAMGVWGTGCMYWY